MPGNRWAIAVGSAALLATVGVPWAGAQEARQVGDAPKRAASFVEAGEFLEDLPRAMLLSPTQGRPAFVEAGGRLRVSARIAEPDAAVVFSLVRTRFPVRRYSLVNDPGVRESVTSGQPLLLRVPDDVPDGTYDLEVRSGDTRLVGRHAVAVRRVGRRIRIAHLSNMNIGDVGAPEFDFRLIDEINLFAPTLIVATGDYLDITHEDPEAGWQRLSDFLAQFNAPTLMACGDHDDLERYSRFAAPSPIGTVELGWFRGVVLFDHPARPVNVDAAQLDWLEQMLTKPGWDGLTFVLTHDDYPNLLGYWRQHGRLERMVRAGRIGVWFVGGHTDWDGREYRALIDAAAPMLFIRTHQSSTAAREGADGVSRYRIVDLIGGRAVLPHDTSRNGAPPSMAVGRLKAVLRGKNDGSQTRVRLTVASGLSYRIDALEMRVRLKKVAGTKPWCHGARLVAADDLGKLWECRISFDLPDKGTLRAVVGSDAEPPKPAVSVRFDLGDELRLRSQSTQAGMSYLSASDQAAVVQIENRGARPVEVKPLVRLDGT
ncbi:MAG TPA: hypothetical protein ENH55_02060, partial [Aurantimonas coralicida]|nr:hypothetical protein [Aurantimonas coralicida]